MEWFPKFNIDSFKTQVMTMGSAIGIGALASSVGADPLMLAGHGAEAGAALSAFAGILAAYGQAAHFDAIKNKLGDPNEVLNNGDLVRLVGETIRQRILAEKTTPANVPHGKILDALANAAPAFWTATATADAVPDDYADLTEGRLVSFFSRIDDLTAEQTALDAQRWRKFIVELANDAGVTGLNSVEYALAEALHRHFPHDLRELLKHAFATGDKAYAAMLFRFFDDLRGGVGDLSAKLDIVVAVLQGQTGTLDALATGQAELKELIQKLQEQLSVKDRQIDGLIGALGTPGANAQAAPTVTPQAQAIADLLPDTGDAFDRALKAIAEKRFDHARQLLDSVIPEEEAALAELEREREAATERLVQRYVARGETEDYDLKYSAAVEWYKKASNLRPNDATLLNRIGILYHSTGNYVTAVNHLEKALAIREQRLGAMHPDTATSLSNLAGLYDSQGLYNKAEPLSVRSLAIREQVLGAMHPDTAASLNNLATLYNSKSLYNKAEPLSVRSLAIREQILGAMHPDTAISLNNLALLYKLQGFYDKAEPLYMRALAIHEQILGAMHPNTATSLNNLATLYDSQGFYDKAEPFYVRSLAIREQILGAMHPDTATSLNNLALLYDSQGFYEKAEPLYMRALAIREQVLGAMHPDTATSLNNLAALYNLQGLYDKADPLYVRILAIREQSLGAMHLDTAQCLYILAGLRYQQNKQGEAKALLDRAYAINLAVLGVEHPDTQKTARSLALLRNQEQTYLSSESAMTKDIKSMF